MDNTSIRDCNLKNIYDTTNDQNLKKKIIELNKSILEGRIISTKPNNENAILISKLMEINTYIKSNKDENIINYWSEFKESNPNIKKLIKSQKTKKVENVFSQSQNSDTIPKEAEPIIGNSTLSNDTYNKIQTEFRENGEDPEQYGNKTANLMRLAIHIRAGKIPPFLGLSDVKIRTFLEKNGINFAEIFAQARQLDKQNNQVICDESCQLLEKLQNEIKRLFIEGDFDTSEVETFLEMIKEQQSARVMVRSTGREDSSENANAGGNLSKVDIAPSAKEICTAIGEVVASYFDKKSLVQSLSTGEDAYKVPFTPVLLQLMVGENPAAATSTSLPSHSSGVMFTREPEGEYDPLAQIQASYGHGEGVVTSQVMCDTYYIHEDIEGNVQRHKIIRDKPSRLVPTGEGGEVQSVMNPKIGRSKGCLPDSALSKLQNIGKQIQELYGMPMDVEWVYDRKNDEIYLVQARPLVKKSKDQTPPSYLDLEKFEDITKGTLIVAAGGSVKTINDASEIIIAKTLSNALDQYIKMSETERKRVKSIITESWAAATSHESTTFRGEQIPVLWMKEPTERLRTSFSQGQKLLFDPQNEMVASVDRYFKEKEATVTGWKNYPIAKELSVYRIEFDSDEQIIEALKDLGAHSKTARPDLSNAKLLDALGNISEPDKALEALSVLSRRLQKFVLANPDKVNREEVQDLFTNFILAGRELKRAIIGYQRTSAGKDQAQMHKAALLSKRWIEALLNQEGGAVAHGLSFHALAEDMNIRKEVNRLWLDQPHPQTTETMVSESEAKELLSRYLPLRQIFMDPELAKRFEHLVLTIAVSRNKANLSRLSQLIYQLQKEGIAIPFLNTEFAQNNELSPHKMLAQLGRAYTKISQETAPLQSFSESLDKWESKLSSWGDQKLFDKNWGEFEKEIIPLMQDRKIIEMLADPNLSAIAKGKVQLLLYRLVDCYDQSIKSMKSGVPYDTNLKIERFKKMLTPYYNMMKLYMSTIDKAKFDALCHCAGTSQNQESILNDIEKKYTQLMNTQDQRQLMPSGQINIASTVFNTKTSFERQFREMKPTLEDCFSLFHQNIIAAIQEHTRAEYELPKELLRCSKLLVDYSASITSIDPFNAPKFEVKYNKPMNNHSSVFTLTYNLKTKTTDLEVKYFGDSRRHKSRGEAILCQAMIYSVTSQLPTPTVYYENQESRISWRFDHEVTEENISALSKGLHYFNLKMNDHNSVHQVNLDEDDAIALLNQGADWFEKLAQTYSPQLCFSLSRTEIDPLASASKLGPGGLILFIFNSFIKNKNENTDIKKLFIKLLSNNPGLIKYIGTPTFELISYLIENLPEDKKHYVWELMQNFGSSD